MLVHSILATGGTSSGPVIDLSGRVVGLMNGSNTIVKGNGARAPNAVQLNFAQRVDLLDAVHTLSPEGVGALRQQWQAGLGSAFVVLPAAGDFLSARVRKALELDAAVALTDARVHTKNVEVPPQADDGTGGQAAVTLSFRGEGPFVVTALDTGARRGPQGRPAARRRVGAHRRPTAPPGLISARAVTASRPGSTGRPAASA